ncbi:MAG: hypothetical protein FWC33_02275 [Candidatus Bathyarchaeota archaeon]|nr:hypothetical protein [Candidatus Termiticorpusculum sp.]
MDNYSFRTIGKILQINHTLVYRWVHEFEARLPTSVTSHDIEQMTFDELWHFVNLKKENFETLKQLIIKHEKQLPNLLTNTILQRLNDSTIKI